MGKRTEKNNKRRSKEEKKRRKKKKKLYQSDVWEKEQTIKM